jgi:hypothetical protein
VKIQKAVMQKMRFSRKPDFYTSYRNGCTNFRLNLIEDFGCGDVEQHILHQTTVRPQINLKKNARLKESQGTFSLLVPQISFFH